MAKAVEGLLQCRFTNEVELPHQSKNDRLRRLIVDIDGESFKIHGAYLLSTEQTTSIPGNFRACWQISASIEKILAVSRRKLSSISPQKMNGALSCDRGR
jgi:hypothetical protein